MNVNEIRLGISSSPSNGRGSARKAFVSAYRTNSSTTPKPVAMKKRFVPNAAPAPIHQEQQEDEEEEDGDFLPSSPRKLYRLPVVSRSPSWTIWILIAWLLMLTLFVLFHFFFSAPLPSSAAPIVELKKNRVKHTVQFILVPDADTGGRLMNMSLKKVVFDRLLRYDVCCFVQTYFVCRSVTRNVGVECYFAQDGTVVVEVNHPNMVGAKCHLIWTEKI